MILEREVEQVLIRKIRSLGGLCLKFVSPGWQGVPDRLCLLPGGQIFFVETKSPGIKPRPLQLKRHEELRALDFDVYVIDSKEGVNAIT